MGWKKTIMGFHSTVLESLFHCRKEKDRDIQKYLLEFFDRKTYMRPLVCVPFIYMKRIDCVYKMKDQHIERLLAHLIIIIYHDFKFNYFFTLCAAFFSFFSRPFFPSSSSTRSSDESVFKIFVTTPVPSVIFPSRIVNRWPFSKTIGLINFSTNLRLQNMIETSVCR